MSNDVKNNNNDWVEYRKHILLTMESLAKADQKATDERNELRKEIANINTQIGILKVKSGVWGAVGSAIILLIAYLLSGNVPMR